MIDYLVTQDGKVVKGKYLGRHPDEFIDTFDFDVIKQIKGDKDFIKTLKSEIDLLKDKIKKEQQEVEEYFNNLDEELNLFQKEKMREAALTIKPGFKKYLLDRYQELYNKIYIPKVKKNTKGSITKADIEKAHNVPIDSLLEFDRNNKTLCLWHNEKTPSLSYKKDKNYVYCFGECGRSYDAIDVYMKLHNCDFKTAVKRLI